ncbi:MAG: hypothetical protein ACQ9ET_00015 [Nitrosomonadaceae bacterium]
MSFLKDSKGGNSSMRLGFLVMILTGCFLCIYPTIQGDPVEVAVVTMVFTLALGGKVAQGNLVEKDNG